jgi:16S rRNA processing protein RimM
MRLDECFELGYIIRPNGTKGAVKALLDVDQPEYYKNLESVFVLQNEQLIPFFLESIQARGQKAVIKFEDIDSIEAAESLKGSSLHLPLQFLPPLDEGQFYYHDIISYTVVDKNEGALGKVVRVMTASHHDFLAMEYKSREVLIPITDEIVIGADHPNEVVNVVLHEGLLEIYL